jgi:signal peptidase I
VIVNKLSYKFHDVNRGDIVVFDRPTCKGSDVPGWATCAESDKIKDLIKRVIALPGDTIELRDGRVWINGRDLSESYVHGQTTDPICAFPSNPAKYTVPKGDVFVMGDNRHNSTDSRCFGPIHTSRIVGRAFIRVWPLGRVAFL